MILPCVPLLSSIGMFHFLSPRVCLCELFQAIYIAFLVVSQMGNIRYMNGQLNTHRLDTIGVGLSLAANVMATALIGYVYWYDMVVSLTWLLILHLLQETQEGHGSGPGETSDYSSGTGVGAPTGIRGYFLSFASICSPRLINYYLRDLLT